MKIKKLIYQNYTRRNIGRAMQLRPVSSLPCGSIFGGEMEEEPRWSVIQQNWACFFGLEQRMVDGSNGGNWARKKIFLADFLSTSTVLNKLLFQCSTKRPKKVAISECEMLVQSIAHPPSLSRGQSSVHVQRGTLDDPRRQ